MTSFLAREDSNHTGLTSPRLEDMLAGLHTATDKQSVPQPVSARPAVCLLIPLGRS